MNLAAATMTRFPQAAMAVAAALLCTGAGGQTARRDGAPELFEPGLVSTGFDESHPAFSPDGRTLYFLRNTPDFARWTVMVTRREGDRWGEPVVAPFSGQWSDADVFVSRDASRLFFISTRPVDGRPKEETDIWVMERVGAGWGAPRHVPELSSAGFEWFPTLTDSGVIYFGSEREGGHGGSDVWRARWLGHRFSEPENLGPNFNTSNQEIEPLIAPDESWLIFAARGRTPSAGAYDLYISWNCPEGWSAPVPLGTGVNSPGWDFAPRTSPDGATFFFASNRSSIAAPSAHAWDSAELERRLSAPGNGLRDIYTVPTGRVLGARRCRRAD